MGGKEVEAFLSMLANVRQVSPSTHRQALSALLFLYKEVLDLELPWLQEIGRPVPTKHIPVVLTVDEVRQILSLMDGVTGLLARLLYGTGLRLRKALSLRVKDFDFDRRMVIVREGKDRVVMLPDGLRTAVKEKLRAAPWSQTIKSVGVLLNLFDIRGTLQKHIANSIFATVVGALQSTSGPSPRLSNTNERLPSNSVNREGVMPSLQGVSKVMNYQPQSMPRSRLTR